MVGQSTNDLEIGLLEIDILHVIKNLVYKISEWLTLFNAIEKKFERCKNLKHIFLSDDSECRKNLGKVY
jgi:hypothetical protein